MGLLDALLLADPGRPEGRGAAEGDVGRGGEGGGRGARGVDSRGAQGHDGGNGGHGADDDKGHRGQRQARPLHPLVEERGELGLRVGVAQKVDEEPREDLAVGRLDGVLLLERLLPHLRGCGSCARVSWAGARDAAGHSLQGPRGLDGRDSPTAST